MNILHMTTYLQGGAGKLIRDFLCHQNSAGHRVFLVTTRTEYPGYCNYPSYLKDLTKENIVVISIDSLFKRTLSKNLHVVEHVQKLIEAHSIDLIHCHASIPAMIALLGRAPFLRRIPVIQTMHGWGTNKTPEHEQQDRIILNSVDQVVAVSQSSKSLLIHKGVTAEHITVIHNGLRLQPEKHSDRKSLYKKIPKTDKVIGCIGTICQRKNQQLLIHASQLLRSYRSDFHVCFIGEDETNSELQQLVTTMGLENVCTFFGYLENASDFIPSFDLLCLPSKAEGLPLSILEGFREKVPVVCSDIPEFQELIIPQKTGFLFQNDCPESLAHTLNLALNMDQSSTNELVERAHQIFGLHFSFTGMMNFYDELYVNQLKFRYSST